MEALLEGLRRPDVAATALANLVRVRSPLRRKMESSDSDGAEREFQEFLRTQFQDDAMSECSMASDSTEAAVVAPPHRASRLNQPPELDDGFEHAPELLDGQSVKAEGELEDAPTPPFPPGRGATKRKRRSAGAPELRDGIAAPERKRRIMPKAALVLGEGLAAGP